MSDLISREAAIKLILSGRVGEDSLVECPAECNSMLEWAADEVAKMPAAEQEPLSEKMKTEKAIERIKAFRDYLCAGNPIWDVDECKEAFDIAIAAMEQRLIPAADVPDRKVGDMINRQAAIDDIKNRDPSQIWDTADIEVWLNALPSAQRWIPFTERELTAEEQEEHPEWSYIMDCPLPDDGQEILVSNGRWVWKDEFCVDDGCYLDSDYELEGCAWMPLPEPWKGE